MWQAEKCQTRLQSLVCQSKKPWWEGEPGRLPFSRSIWGSPPLIPPGKTEILVNFLPPLGSETSTSDAHLRSLLEDFLVPSVYGKLSWWSSAKPRCRIRAFQTRTIHYPKHRSTVGTCNHMAIAGLFLPNISRESWSRGLTILQRQHKKEGSH